MTLSLILIIILLYILLTGCWKVKEKTDYKEKYNKLNKEFLDMANYYEKTITDLSKQEELLRYKLKEKVNKEVYKEETKSYNEEPHIYNYELPWEDVLLKYSC